MGSSSLTTAKRREIRGAAFLEFAICFPVVVVCMWGIIEVSRAVVAHGPMGNVAYLATRAGIESSPSEAKARANAMAQNLMRDEMQNRNLLVKGDSVSISSTLEPSGTLLTTSIQSQVSGNHIFAPTVRVGFSADSLQSNTGLFSIGDGFTPDVMPTDKCDQSTMRVRGTNEICSVELDLLEGFTKYGEISLSDELVEVPEVPLGEDATDTSKNLGVPTEDFVSTAYSG